MTSDEDLIAASRRDPLAFEPLVTRHGADLHAYLVRRTAGGAADDLLAEVWLAAFGGRRRFDPRAGTVRGWLFGIARYVLLGHYRRVGRQPVPFDSPRPVADETEAIDARLDAAGLVPRLRLALAGLPQVERELLLLVAWEELSPGEAAQALGIRPGTARSRLHRARQRMNEHLAPATQVLGDKAAHGQGDER